MTAKYPSREAIEELAKLAGLSGELALEPLDGGGNNRVYHLRTRERQAVVKWYFSSLDDRRDRLASETAFLRFAERRGLSQTPRLYAAIPAERLALMEYIPGDKLAVWQVTERHVAEAAEFYRALNADRATADASVLPCASEACFSVFDHFACVRDRVVALSSIPTDDGELQDLLHVELPAAWKEVMSNALDWSRDPGVTLAQEDRRLSPSDFGFHNAIVAASAVESERLRFIDFEYAGWDDPAKTACDFACQVQVPVSKELATRFARSIAASDPRVAERIEVLLPVYRVKWCCIVLNRLVGVGNSRRNFSGAGADAQSIKQQARNLLDLATTT